MGLILDTNILIQIEKNNKAIDFDVWQSNGEAFLSAISVSELWVGVHLANSEARRLKRAAFVSALLNRIRVLDFTADVATIHSQIYASLASHGQLIGAHDLIIAATALSHGYPVLTLNGKEFKRVPGLDVLEPS